MSADRPFHNPFAVLGKLGGARPADAPAAPEPGPPAAPARPTSAAQSAPASAAAAQPAARIPRAVVRFERAGRGGKAVTAIEHLTIPPAERDRWLKALKAALGCGGVIEGDAIVLQGDHRARLPGLLSARGVKKVTIG